MRLRTLLLGLSVLLLTGCVTFSSLPVSEQIVKLEARGDSAVQSGHYQQAHDNWQQALRLMQSVQPSQATAALLLKLARVNEILGNFESAIDDAQAALAEANDNQKLQAQAQSLLAIAYRRVGDVRESQARSKAALQLARAVRNTAVQSESLRNLGTLAKERGEMSLALGYLEKARDTAMAAGDQQRLAESLHELGGWYHLQADYEKALQHYQTSYSMLRALQDVAGQSRLLGDLCSTYQALNQYTQAVALCKQSLALARRSGDDARTANNLNNLAGLYQNMGETRQAFQALTESLALKRKLGDKAGIGRSLSNLGDLYRQQQNFDKAIDLYQQALGVKRAIGDWPGISATEYRLGLISLELGDHANAKLHFERALLQQLSSGQRDLLWRIQAGLQSVYTRTAIPRLAIFFGKQSVNTIQSVRADIQSLPRSQQRSYLQDKLEIYRQLANLLIDEGRLLEAQQVLDLLKEEEYSDFVRSSLPASVQSDGVASTTGEIEWERRYLELSHKLIALGLEYNALRVRRSSDLSEAESLRRNELALQLAEAFEVSNNFLLALEAYFASQELPDGGLPPQERESLQSLQNVLAKFQKDYDYHPVVIYYLTDKEKLRILVAGPNSRIPPVLCESMIGRSELNHLIQGFRTKLIEQQDDYLAQAQTLHRWLIEPMQHALDQFNADTLMIYGDGALRYLPFAALYDAAKEQFIAERYALVMYTAAARENLDNEPTTEDWKVAAFGVARSPLSDEFQDLPAVGDELDAIVKEEVVPPDTQPDPRGILPGNSFLDEQFTADELSWNLDQETVRVIHIATHFKLTPGSWDDSFLLLGSGDELKLSLQRFFTGEFSLANAELLTFSACETALDVQQENGQEIEGLGTLAQQKGAHAVLATLWKVADPSTAEFMERFYRLRMSTAGSKARALQAAQQVFINEARDQNNGAIDVQRGAIRTDATEVIWPGFSHPYYWAPFVLMGNWL